MSHQFPGASLIMQLFRQVTRPASRGIVVYASRHPIFKKYFLLKPGRAYHRVEMSIQMLKTPTEVVMTKDGGNKKSKGSLKIPAIKDEEAIEIGSQLMIEIVLFGLLVVLLVIDYIRSQLKSGREEAQYQQELEKMEERKSAAKTRLEGLEREVQVLRARLIDELKTAADAVVQPDVDNPPENTTES